MKLCDIADIRVTGEDILPDDILLQRVGTVESVGRVFLGDSTDRPQNTISIRLTDYGRTVVYHQYLYYILQALHMHGYFRKLARGTAQQAIRVSDVQDIRLG